MGVLILTFAFTQGVFPKPPDFAKLNAFDLSFFAGHPRFTLFLLTALAIGALVAFAVFSSRVRAFWARVRQGLTILRDRRRYLREVFARAARRLVLPLHRVLVPARGLQHRRLGAQRPARARGQRGGLGRALHPRRRGRAAGLPGQGLRRDGERQHGGGLLGGPADRHRRVQPGAGLRRARGDLPLPLLPRGAARGPRRSARPSARPPAPAPARSDPDGPRARARRPRGRRSP